MFTGLVEEVGSVRRITRGAHSAVLEIACRTVLEGTKIGDSIAVNGICLTVTALSPQSFCADVMHETLDRSSLAGLASGSPVNLERAMAANGRFGGHIVSGHIDGTGTIASQKREDNAVWVKIKTPERQHHHRRHQSHSRRCDGAGFFHQRHSPHRRADGAQRAARRRRRQS